MNISKNTQAVLLLTAWFSKPGKSDPKPLTPTEWGRFASWLREQSMKPADLINGQMDQILSQWHDQKITRERLDKLMDRGGALGLAMEKWERTGLWVVTRSDQDYPTRLKKHLGAKSPPLLFGYGHSQLLNQGGIAVVGSRNASNTDLEYTRALGRQVASEGYSIISGGARGVDETAMLGALDTEGTVVGVLSDNLIKAANSKKYRRDLMNGNLVLVSPFYPEARFNVGNAMARNKYIYCLSDAAVVIACEQGKGGTWSGAQEAMKNEWVPVWAKSDKDALPGNIALIENGARGLPQGSFPIASLLRTEEKTPKTANGDHEFLSPAHEEEATNVGSDTPATYSVEAGGVPGEKAVELKDFYSFFLLHLEQATSHYPKTVEELSELLELHKPQLKAWLKQAEEEGKVDKLSRPVRYQWVSEALNQISLLDDADSQDQSGNKTGDS